MHAAQVSFSGAHGYAELNFRPASITYRLYLFDIVAPRAARVHIGVPGAAHCPMVLSMIFRIWHMHVA
jgi:hypothetical protein